MGPAPDTRELGVFMHDRVRSIVAISDDGELGVALREHVDPSRAVIRDVRAAECATALRACEPWPWLVAGSTAVVPAPLGPFLASRPSLVVWSGGRPASLPMHAHLTARFADLAAIVDRALDAEVGGMRLAAGSGVEIGDGRSVRSAALEALIAAGPDGFDLPLRAFRSAARVLRDLNLGWQPCRDRRTGRVVLARADHEAAVAS